MAAPFDFDPSLGSTPLANALLTSDQLSSTRAKISLGPGFLSARTRVFTETVPPEILFGEYVYFSSFSETALHNASQIAQRMIAERRLDGSSLAWEIASNDGYLLQTYAQAGIPVLGIEPAHNIAQVAQAKGIRTQNLFFNAAVAAQLRQPGRACRCHPCQQCAGACCGFEWGCGGAEHLAGRKMASP